MQRGCTAASSCRLVRQMKQVKPTLPALCRLFWDVKAECSRRSPRLDSLVSCQFQVYDVRTSHCDDELRGERAACVRALRTASVRSIVWSHQSIIRPSRHGGALQNKKTQKEVPRTPVAILDVDWRASIIDSPEYQAFFTRTFMPYLVWQKIVRKCQEGRESGP